MLPELWFLSYNKKFKISVISAWVGSSPETDLDMNFWKILENRNSRYVRHFFSIVNTIWRLKKIYLHRPMKILYVLPAGDFQTALHDSNIFLHLQQYATFKLSCTFNMRFSPMLFLFILQFHDHILLYP